MVRKTSAGSSSDRRDGGADRRGSAGLVAETGDVTENGQYNRWPTTGESWIVGGGSAVPRRLLPLATRVDPIYHFVDQRYWRLSEMKHTLQHDLMVSSLLLCRNENLAAYRDAPRVAFMNGLHRDVGKTSFPNPRHVLSDIRVDALPRFLIGGIHAIGGQCAFRPFLVAATHEYSKNQHAHPCFANAVHHRPFANRSISCRLQYQLHRSRRPGSSAL